jgi:hypothetical protein
MAMVAAYALAFQLLLSGFAAGHFMATSDASLSDPFVVCHGGGVSPSDRQDVPAKPLAQVPCVLCTLTQAACAILPLAHGIGTTDGIMVSDVGLPADSGIIAFESPTGQYQRGPPLAASISADQSLAGPIGPSARPA